MRRQDQQKGSMRGSMKYIPVFILALLISVFSCGGGGGSGSSGGVAPPSIVASFSADKSTPDTMDVTLQRKSQSGDSVTVDVIVTDVNGIYSAAFDLVYDGTVLDYLNYTEGDFLNGDGASTTFQVAEQSGRLVIGASRLNPAPEINAVGDKVLMSIAFRLRKTASSSITFENNALLNSSLATIQAVEWFGGTASGS